MGTKDEAFDKPFTLQSEQSQNQENIVPGTLSQEASVQYLGSQPFQSDGQSAFPSAQPTLSQTQGTSHKMDVESDKPQTADKDLMKAIFKELSSMKKDGKTIKLDAVFDKFVQDHRRSHKEIELSLAELERLNRIVIDKQERSVHLL